MSPKHHHNKKVYNAAAYYKLLLSSSYLVNTNKEKCRNSTPPNTGTWNNGKNQQQNQSIDPPVNVGSEPFNPCYFEGCPNINNVPFHVYPGSPLEGDLILYQDCTNQHKGARDFATLTTEVDSPVYVAEPGTIIGIASGNPNTGPANVVSIKSDFDNYLTQYVHVTALPGLTPGMHVNTGNQIGTVDLSNNSPLPHVHMARYIPPNDSNNPFPPSPNDPNPLWYPTCNWTLQGGYTTFP